MMGLPRAMGQCEAGWQQGYGGAGLNGTVHALHAEVDGSIIVGGSFSTAGGSPAQNIATLRGSTWTAMGSGVDGTVRAITTRANGEIIVGGEFVNAGGIRVNHIARWDGTEWRPLGSGLSSQIGNPIVYALATLANDDVVVAGNFRIDGVADAVHIARWDGENWFSIGTPPNQIFTAVIVRPNGDIAGATSGAPTTGEGRVVQWNGSAWTPLGASIWGSIHCFANLSNGQLLAGGSRTNFQPPKFYNYTTLLQRWNGTSWIELGFAQLSFTHPRPVYALTALSGDGYLAGGYFVLPNNHESSIYSWQNNSASSLGYLGFVRTLLTLPNGDVVAGGSFDRSGGAGEFNIGRYRFSVCPADFNCDDAADLFDYLDFVNAFAQLLATADVNRDGVVDVADYLEFVEWFNASC